MVRILRLLGFFFGEYIHRLDYNKKNHTNFGTNNQTTRENWLENTLKQIPSGYRILDAGAGELKYKKFCSHLDYVSQDFGKYNGIGNSEGLQTKNWDNSKLDIICDIIDIPETEASFDVIMCIEVFEHLSDPLLAIKEFNRLLKKNGTLIITAPFCSLTHFTPYHFYTGFNKYFYEKHLNGNGFEIEELVANGNYFEFLAQEIQFRIPNQFTNHKLSKNERNIKNKFLSLLEVMNNHSQKSENLLCFGYQIKSRKK